MQARPTASTRRRCRPRSSPRPPWWNLALSACGRASGAPQRQSRRRCRGQAAACPPKPRVGPVPEAPRRCVGRAPIQLRALSGGPAARPQKPAARRPTSSERTTGPATHASKTPQRSGGDSGLADFASSHLTWGAPVLEGALNVPAKRRCVRWRCHRKRKRDSSFSHGPFDAPSTWPSRFRRFRSTS